MPLRIQEIAKIWLCLKFILVCFQNNSFRRIKADFIELLELLEFKFNIARNAITICTLPPLANLSFMSDFEKTSTLRSFNNWLRQMVGEKTDFVCGNYSAYQLVDFYDAFTNDADAISYEYFQEWVSKRTSNF